MTDLVPAVLLMLLGAGGLALWVNARRHESVWRRSVAAFSASTSQRFAHGFAGSSIFLYIGLTVEGAAFALFAWTEADPSGGSRGIDDRLVLAVVASCSLVMVVGVMLGLLLAWLQWPTWLYPHGRTLKSRFGARRGGAVPRA